MSQQKRQFVRIRDVVRLSYEVVPESGLAEALQRMNSLRNQDADRYPFRPRYIGRFGEGESNPVYRTLIEAINRLDQKMDYIILLIDKLNDREKSDHYGNPVRCDLSGSGMMFACEEKLAQGAFLRMSLLLGTYNITMPIHLIARVVRVQGNDPKYGPQPYRIAVRFESLSEDDRELIINHVFEIQKAELRMRGGEPGRPERG